MGSSTGDSLGHGTIGSGSGWGSSPGSLNPSVSQRGIQAPRYGTETISSNDSNMRGISCRYSPAYGANAPVTQTDIDVALATQALAAMGKTGLVMYTEAANGTDGFRIELEIVDGAGPSVVRGLYPRDSGLSNTSYSPQTNYSQQSTGQQSTFAPSSGIQNFPTAQKTR